MSHRVQEQSLWCLNSVVEERHAFPRQNKNLPLYPDRECVRKGREGPIAPVPVEHVQLNTMRLLHPPPKLNFGCAGPPSTMHTQTKLGAKSVPRFARNIFRSRNDNTFNIVLVGVVAPFGKLEVSFTVCPPEKLDFVFAGPPFQRQCWSRNWIRASQEQVSDRATTTPSTLFCWVGRGGGAIWETRS